MGKGKGYAGASDLLGGEPDWSFGPAVSVSDVTLSDEELEELEREISR